MRSFTNEELKQLEAYEDRFNTALNGNFVRNLEPRYLDKIKSIYDAASNTNNTVNAFCSHCVLVFIKTVAVKYFEDCLKAVSKKAEEASESVNTVIEKTKKIVEDSKPKKPVNKKQNKKK